MKKDLTQVMKLYLSKIGEKIYEITQNWFFKHVQMVPFYFFSNKGFTKNIPKALTPHYDHLCSLVDVF